MAMCALKWCNDEGLGKHFVFSYIWPLVGRQAEPFPFYTLMILWLSQDLCSHLLLKHIDDHSKHCLYKSWAADKIPKFPHLHWIVIASLPSASVHTNLSADKELRKMSSENTKRAMKMSQYNYVKVPRLDLIWQGAAGGLATVQEQEKEMQSMQWLLLFEENAISEISKMNSGQFPGTNAIFESSQRYSSDTSGYPCHKEFDFKLLLEYCTGVAEKK